MNFFEEATLRLKQQLRVIEDKQAAEALGMTGNAWTQRKRRGAFPEKELRALAQQRPELDIDVEYVLTGEHLGLTTDGWGSKERAFAEIARTAGELVPDLGEKSTAVKGRRPSSKEAGASTTFMPPVVSDEARLLAAFRASDSAGRAAILLAARGIAGLTQA